MNFRNLAVLLTSFTACVAFATHADAVTLEQIISREHPTFNVESSVLNTGRDGLVYLSCGGNGTGYVLRMTPDGKNKLGGPVVYATANATANDKGTIGVASGHFAHSISFYNRVFDKSNTQNDFLVSDAAGWDAPAWVAAGESGDFYAVDQHRDRILRLSQEGKILRSFAIPHSPDAGGGLISQIRVNEKQQQLYVMTRQGPLRVFGFDGQLKWDKPIAANWGSGGYDVDAQGKLYVIGVNDDTIKTWDANGNPGADIKLQMGDGKPVPNGANIRSMAIAGNEILVKRNHPTELFQRFNLTTGEKLGTVYADNERLAATYDKDLWTAGESVSFTLQFNAGGRPLKPQWHVWLRPLSSPDYRELKVENGALAVPADAAGIYQLKVTPETQPLENGRASEYVVRGWVEIRKPDSRGTINVFSPLNRVYYAEGETVPLSVLVRSTSTKAVPVTVSLKENGGGKVLAQTSGTPDGNGVLSLTLPGSLTMALRAGSYTVTAESTGYTPVPQQLVIGPGDDGTTFHIVRHGDYGETYPNASLWRADDVVSSYIEREGKLGFNLLADRIGTPQQIGALDWGGVDRAEADALAKKLEADAAGVAPEKVRTGSVLNQVMAAYSAQGIDEMPILLMMDAGLPIGGPGFDNRKPDQLQKDITKVTQAFLPYRSFRGWTWHSNWWIYDKRGSNAARSPEEKTAYETALKNARDTGAWDPVLDSVSNYRLGFAVDAQDMFKKDMDGAAPGNKLITASAGTYRNVESYPPISFQNVDEVDLQGQFEQIFMPYFPPHAVDFYRRPGKPVWGHPEIWNDSGTGDQVTPMLFSMVMRGADGVGPSGRVPPWQGDRNSGAWREDPRLSHFGTASVFRATNNVLKRYGSWLRTLQSDDDVAIAVSGRPFKVDEWTAATGKHFARVMEAWVTCLQAHHPASFVFAEDVKPDSFKKYKAVLVVGQYMEMEPQLAAAIKNAQAAGTKVFADGTCRAEIVKDYTVLDVRFDKFENDRHPASDDAAYYRFPQYIAANLPVVQKALDAATQPVAKIDNPEVWASQRTSGKGRYLFVVNNTTPPLEPGQMWRTTTLQSSRMPVEEKVGLTENAPAVYDVFAMKKITPQNNAVDADLRYLPARLYALLPTPIAGVALRGPSNAGAGSTFKWWAQVRDAAGKGIESSIPLRVRLLGASGAVLREMYPAADADGVSSQLTVPLNADGTLTLEATELLSGQSVRVAIATKAATLPVAFNTNFTAATADSSGKATNASINPSADEFGPHVRDIAVLESGKVAVLNTNNWDRNLYGIDCDTGKILWRDRAGDYFAFAPQAIGNAFVAQGFDNDSAEGYHLYLGDETGRLARRFALYGLPRRLPHRFVPGLFGDRDNPIDNFAAAPAGGWVASAGDMGLAVWARDGKLLWKQDWWKSNRRTARLDAPDEDSLLVAEIGQGVKVTSYNARSGKAEWNLDLAPSGIVQRIAHSADGKTVALMTDYEGGRVFILRGGKLVNALTTSALDMTLSPDGQRLAIVDQNQLKMYGTADGLRWIYSGDDVLRAPRFAPDGRRLALGTELGTLCVLDENGKAVYEQDNGALTVPAWLPGGDLLVGNWMGKMARLDPAYKPRWTALLRPASGEAPPKKDEPTTLRVADWGNAETTPLPMTPNLLADTKSVIRFVAEGANYIQFSQPYATLADGKLDAPQQPWLLWSDVNWFAESNAPISVEFDAFRTQMRLDAVTFYEDPAHPESWMRDAKLEYWDADKEQWTFIQNLLSDSAVHTHKLAKPVEAGKFRVALPKGMFGNLRWSEIVFHGQALGGSHPDIVAKRPRAVLFDESDTWKNVYPYTDRWSFKFDGAYSGGRLLQVNANQNIAPQFVPPYGHMVPTWDFEIAENPQPGQYRYLQFAVKALSPDAKGAALMISGEDMGARAFGLGEAFKFEGAQPIPTNQPLTQEWQTVRVDLWDLLKKNARLRTMYFGANGGPVGFDQIVLGRTLADLPEEKRP